MSEYIERDRLLKVLEHNFCGIGGADVMRQLIEMQPAADAAPVVRCKDCKYWHRALLKSEDGSPVDFGICDFMKDDVDTDEKDFCSLGERIDKNE
jgi:hypothetical protein|nr:MAG TPA: hypothetical protein [Caudoviricetes sp.]